MKESYQPRIILIILILMISNLASSCIMEISLPFSLLENNLIFNQHEVLRNLFTFEFQSINRNESNFKFESQYIDQYNRNRFMIQGNINQSITLTIQSLPLKVIISNKNQTDRKNQQQQIYLEFRSIQIRIGIQSNQDGSYALIVKEVETDYQDNIKYQGEHGIPRHQIKEMITSQIQERILSIQEKNLQELFEILPHETILLNWALLQSFTFWTPITAHNQLLFCFQNEQINLDQKQQIGQIIQKSKSIQSFSQFGAFVINQQNINEALQNLHKRDNTVKLPLSADQIQSAIETLKPEFPQFSNAKSLDLSLFFNEERFLEFWDEDEFQISTFKIEQGGILTLQSNIGAIIDIINNDGSTQKLTALIKLNIKLQLQHPFRRTNSLGKKWIDFVIHNFFFPKISLYDHNDNLLNTESMKALVGVNLEVQKQVKFLNDRWAWILARDIYLQPDEHGDIFITSYIERYGFHFLRAFTECEPSEYFAFAILFDVEDLSIDPDRQERINRFFKREIDCENTLQAGLRSSSYGPLNELNQAYFEYCKKLKNKKGLPLNDMSVIDYMSKFGDMHAPRGVPVRYELQGVHLFQLGDHLYLTRYTLMVAAHCIAIILFIIYTRIIQKDNKQS